MSSYELFLNKIQLYVIDVMDVRTNFWFYYEHYVQSNKKEGLCVAHKKLHQDVYDDKANM